MQKELVIFFSIVFTLYSGLLIGQELGFQSSWTLGIGLSHSNLSPTQNITKTENNALLIKDIENFGPRTGWSFNSGLYQRINRIWGLYGELSILYSRRKGTFEERLTYESTIFSKHGELRYNNLHAQFLLAPRIQFGQFNRFYMSIGPYFDQNLWNFSSYQSLDTYYSVPEPIVENGEVTFPTLDEPIIQNNKHRADIRPFDFGGVVMLGTLLSLPGKNMLQLELRYSRGVFRLGDIPGVRQNRFIIFIGYGINTYSNNESFRKYIPFSQG